MAGMYGYSREAVRVKVKKCEGHLPPEWRKFSVDPQITSLEVLMSILAKAFDLRADFSVSYRTSDPAGLEIFTAVLSDWDLDAAFLRAHNISLSTGTEPCLCLRVDMKPFSETCEEPEWDPSDQPQEAINEPINSYNGVVNTSSANSNTVEKRDGILKQHRLQGIFMNQMEKTINMVQRALNLVDDSWNTVESPPLGDTEFRSLLDAVGRLQVPQRLRRRVYIGGVEPALRRVVWKHVLNVYPEGMTGRERISYIKRKSLEYINLRDTWRNIIQSGPITPQLSYVTSMVRKDVLRTDRHHPFYAGSDDNKNIASLFNILTTYALNHKVSYCQGMSDLASPLLVTMNDEATAYICFCALMKRLHGNFMLDGIAMTQKFTHLSEALMYYDAEFYAYLKQQQADDLLFCYRWLLLEMKREFCFEDSLRMLEVLWSSIPSVPPQTELCLFETEFKPVFATPSPQIIPKENAYIKVCALRRQSSAMNLQSGTVKLKTAKRLNQSLDENRGRCKIKNSLQDVKTFSLDDAILQSKMENKIKVETDIDLKSKNKTINEKQEPLNETKSLNDEQNKNDFAAVEVISNDLQTVLDLETTRNQILHCDSIERPRSVSPNDQKISMPPNSQISSSMTNLVTKSNSFKRGGHFKDLKERIAAGKKGIFNSLDKIDVSKNTEINPNKPKGRVVKNLNEFLNFNKSRISDKLVLRKNSQPVISNSEKPVILLSKSSFDDSESSAEITSSKPLHVNLIGKSLDRDISLDGSSPDDSQDYFPMTTSMTRELRLEMESLDRQVFGSDFHNKSLKFECDSPESDSISTEIVKNCDCVLSKQSSEIIELSETTEIAEICSAPKQNGFKNDLNHIGISDKIKTDDIYVWENPLHKVSPQLKIQKGLNYPTTPDEQADLEYDEDTGEIFEETHGKKSVTPIRLLRKTQNNSNRNSEIHSSDSSESDDWKLSDNRKSNQNVIERTTSCEAQILNQSDISHNNDFKPIEIPIENCNAASPTMDNTNNFEKNLNLETNIGEDVVEQANSFRPGVLPPPREFGGGNPFLMFLCLTLLLQHRDFVIRNAMDYNEMAMHFDKMVRKHNVIRVLNQARKMFAAYLKQQNNNSSDVSV